MMTAGRIGTLFFWGLVIAGLAGWLPGQFNGWLVRLGGLVLLAHIGEVVLMYTLWKEKLSPKPKDIAQTLLYGAFYLKPKMDAANQEG